MLSNYQQKPSIPSKTRINNLKHSNYNSLGKKDLSSEVTLELPELYHGFTKMTPDMILSLQLLDEKSFKVPFKHYPMDDGSPFCHYISYLFSKDDVTGINGKPSSFPEDWFSYGAFLYCLDRKIRFPFKKEFSVEFIPKRDLSLIEEEYDRKITIRLVWEDNEYIELRVLRYVILQSLLNLVLREPLWTRRYQIFVDNHKLNVFEDIWHSLGNLERLGIIYDHCVINIRLSPKSVRYTTWLYFLSHGHFFKDK